MSDKKENILDAIKAFLLLFMMVQGFFFTYALIWYGIGLPQTKWALGLLYAIALLTEYGYYRWLRA